MSLLGSMPPAAGVLAPGGGLCAHGTQ